MSEGVVECVGAVLMDKPERAITPAQLRAWAENRKAEASREYSHDGRGTYGDIAGAIEVCDELIEWCDEMDSPDHDGAKE